MIKRAKEELVVSRMDGLLEFGEFFWLALAIFHLGAQRSITEKPHRAISQRWLMSAHVISRLLEPGAIIDGASNHDCLIVDGADFGADRLKFDNPANCLELLSNAFGNALCCSVFARIRNQDCHVRPPFDGPSKQSGMSQRYL